MNYFRLGMSESSLLFLFFIEKNIKNYNRELLKYYRIIILNWFYSTSGFFDIDIKGNYFNFDEEYDKIISSKPYLNYFNNLLNFIKTNEFKLFHFRCHNLDKFMSLLPVFFNYINKDLNSFNCPYPMNDIIINNFNNKTVLLIHNLSELMINQYENGNLNKINSLFPKVNKFISIKLGYTFLNKPLDGANNIIDRTIMINEYIEFKIKETNSDFIVISCGAYSSLIASFLQGKINYCMIGGELEKEFGIITNRHKDNIIKSEYHIYVPHELKPEFHNDIENSCYW